MSGNYYNEPVTQQQLEAYGWPIKPTKRMINRLREAAENRAKNYWKGKDKSNRQERARLSRQLDKAKAFNSALQYHITYLKIL